MSADGKSARGRTRILLILQEKETVKSLANYNKTKIKIGHQHNCWMELKEALRVQIHAAVHLRM